MYQLWLQKNQIHRNGVQFLYGDNDFWDNINITQTRYYARSKQFLVGNSFKEKGRWKVYKSYNINIAAIEMLKVSQMRYLEIHRVYEMFKVHAYMHKTLFQFYQFVYIIVNQNHLPA